MSFKEFFTEADKNKRPLRKPKLSGYAVPPPSARFKEGDIVAVHIPRDASKEELLQYFRTYHPQLAVPYMNSVGTVRLYNKGQFSSKYAVEFEDGNVIPIATMFLIGPFKSVESAKKYAGKHSLRSLKISPEDLQGFVPDASVEVNSKIEDEFKRAFVNNEVGFKWLDEPVVVKYKKFDVYVLAYKKSKFENYQHSYLSFVNNHDEPDREDNPNRPEFDNAFVFCKVVDKRTKKLLKTQVISSVGVSGIYFLQRPHMPWYSQEAMFEGDQVKQADQLFRAEMLPLGSVSRNKEVITKEFSVYDQCDKLIKNGWDHFKFLYSLDENTMTVKSEKDYHKITIDQKKLGKNFDKIQQLTIEGDCDIRYESGVKTIYGLPRKIVGGLSINGTHFHSLEGLDKTEIVETLQSNIFASGMGRGIDILAEIDTLEHFPQSLNKAHTRFSFRGKLNSLKGIPDESFCDLVISELVSFNGASNCVNKGHITIYSPPKNLTGFFKDEGELESMKLDKSKVEDMKKVRELENEFPEIAGTFM